MADTDSTETQNDNDTHHEPHQWHRKAVEDALIPGRNVADFAGRVMDMAGGISSLSSLLVENQRLLDGDNPDGKPLFSAYDSDILQRLVTVCAGDLRQEAENLLDWSFKYHTAEGRKSNVEFQRNYAESLEAEVKAARKQKSG
jgi:hypothetical protein